MDFSKLFKPPIFILLLLLFFGKQMTYGNTEKVLITEHQNQRSLVEVLKEFGEKYQVYFTYEEELLRDVKIDFQFKEAESMESAINRLLAQTGFSYKRYNERFMVIFENTKKGNKSARKLTRKMKQIKKLEQKGKLKFKISESNHSNKFNDILTAISDIQDDQIEVSGTVKDESGLALIGVNILEKGTSNGTITDLDGNFLIQVAQNAVLQFSYTGYKDQEVSIENATKLEIILSEDIAQLEEVVVVGYGVVKKRDLTGSVGKVDIEEVSKTPAARIDQAIQGRVAGVQVTSVNGQPGAGTTIRIRGGNSINAGNEPLYVIDGFIGGIDINSINPEDIESIEVLKDASSLSIYGARGSNGVILITTKKGKEGKTNLSLNTYYGVQSLARKLDLLNGADYMRWVNQGEAFLGNAPVFSEEAISQIGEGTDWQEELTRTAPIYSLKLGLSGGTKKTKYYLSGSYFNQDGIFIGNTYNRAQLRLNLDHKFSDFFEMGTAVNLSRIANTPQKFNAGSVYTAAPAQPVLLEDGTYSVVNPVNGTNFNNPIAQEEFVENQSFTNQLYTNTYLQFNILPNLHFRSTLGMSLRNGKTNKFTSSQLPVRLRNGQPAIGSILNSDRVSYLTENTLTYSLDLDERHSLNFLTGFTYQRQQTETAESISDNIQNDLVSFYGIGLSNPEDTRSKYEYSAFKISSLIARVNYALDNKYLFTLTARRDGSSKFGTNNRYAFFPSMAMAWRISEEGFLKDADIFDHLKFRISYGRSGNSNGIGAFRRFQALGTGFSSLGTGSRSVAIFNKQLSNPDLRWETTDQYDVGVEFGFFDGKLSFELDYYYKKTKDLLFTREISSQTGFESRLENIGSLENRGIDFLTRAVIFKKKNISWDLTFNISTYKNKILELGSDNNIVTRTHGVNISNPSGQLIVGHPLGIFTGWNVLGVYADQAAVEADELTNKFQPGDFRYEDINNDGTIDQNDVHIIGDSNPDFFGGLQNTLTIQNFDISAFVQFSVGNDILNERKLFSTRTQIGTAYANFNTAWTPENINTDIPAAQSQNAQAVSSFAVEDASFVRLKNISIGYTVPFASQSANIKSLRFYITANNLFQIVSSEYSNYDPEVNTQGQNDRLRGYDNIAYPTAKTLLFGLSAKF